MSTTHSEVKQQSESNKLTFAQSNETIQGNTLFVPTQHSATNNFLQRIGKGEFKDAKELLLLNLEYINKIFTDTSGNTIMHFVIYYFLQNLKNKCEQWVEFNRNSNDFNKQKNEEKILKEYIEKLTSEFYSLIDILLDLNFPFISTANNGLKAVHYFRGFQIPLPMGAPSVSDIERIIIEKFEKKGRFIFAGRKYVSNLTLCRTSKKNEKGVVIPDRWQFSGADDDGYPLSIHQHLELTERYLKQWGFSNLVVANIGFLVSDVPKKNGAHKPTFRTIPICDPDLLIAKSKTAPSTHAEAALYEHLQNITNLEHIVNDLKGLFPNAGHKIYAVIFDIYSTREVCEDCEQFLHKLQAEYFQGSFLHMLELLLTKNNHFVLPRNLSSLVALSQEAPPQASPHLKVIIRVSGFDNPNWRGKQGANYPKPVILCEKEGAEAITQRDIKNHEQLALFHLAPRNTESAVRYSQLVPYKEEPRLVESYEQRNVALIRKGAKISIFLNTAFCNGGGNDNQVLRRELPKPPKPFHLQYEHHLKKFKLNQFYLEDEVISKIQEVVEFPQETISTILEYFAPYLKAK